MKEEYKNNLIFTVAIVWRRSCGELVLRSSVYCVDDGDVKNKDEALGKAMGKQKSELDNPGDLALIMHSISSTWKTHNKVGLECLRYC